MIFSLNTSGFGISAFSGGTGVFVSRLTFGTDHDAQGLVTPFFFKKSSSDFSLFLPASPLVANKPPYQ